MTIKIDLTDSQTRDIQFLADASVPPGETPPTADEYLLARINELVAGYQRQRRDLDRAEVEEKFQQLPEDRQEAALVAFKEAVEQPLADPQKEKR